MHFNCPECGTAGQYPDSQIGELGVMTNCATCGRHIRLEPAGFQEDDRTEALLGEDEIEPLPPVSGSLSGQFLKATSRSELPESAPRHISRPTSTGMPLPATRRPETLGRQTSEHVAAVDHEPRAPHTMESERWGYRDLPMAIRAIFDVNRFIATTMCSWIILIIFVVLQWLSSWLSTEVEALGSIFSSIGWIVLAFGMCLLAAATAYISQAKVIEERDCPFSLGVDWVKAWLHSILGTPLLVVGLIGSAILVESLLGFVGRIPYFGPIFWGVTSPISALMNLIACALIVALAYGITLYVPVIYHVRSGPRDTIVQLKSIISRTPAQLLALIFTSQAMILSFMAATIGPIFIMSMPLGNRVASTSMGLDLVGISQAAPAVFQFFLSLVVGPMMAIGTQVPSGTLYSVSGGVAGVGATIVPAMVISIWLIATQTAGCIIYAVIKERRK